MQSEENKCSGSYYVSDYTKDDGTKVEGYVRTCWKHGKGKDITVEQVDSVRDEIDKNIRDLTLKDEISEQDVDTVLIKFDDLVTKTIDLQKNIEEEKENLPKEVSIENNQLKQKVEKKEKGLKENVYKMIRTVNIIEHLTEKQWKKAKSNDENLLKRVKVLNKQKQLNDGLSDLYTGLSYNRKGQIEMAISTLLETEISDGNNTNTLNNTNISNPIKENEISTAETKTPSGASNNAVTTNIDNVTEEKSNKIENNQVNLSWIKPVKNMVITSKFGNRYHQILKKYIHHDGIDIGVPINTPIYAVADGQVAVAGWANGYGNYIKIKHSNGVESFYGHLNSIDVQIGNKVNQGQIIGKSGNTGRSKDAHLHFGLHLYGKSVNPLDYIK